MALNGYCMYFLRANTKRTLGEETFQRDILGGLINASKTENILWNIERIFSNIFIPYLNRFVKRKYQFTPIIFIDFCHFLPAAKRWPTRARRSWRVK